MKQYTVRATVLVRGEVVHPILVSTKINDVLEEVESLLTKGNTQGINIEVREVVQSSSWGLFKAGVPMTSPV